MSDLAISFAPLIPWWFIAVLAGISVLIAAYGLFVTFDPDQIDQAQNEDRSDA